MPPEALWSAPSRPPRPSIYPPKRLPRLMPTQRFLLFQVGATGSPVLAKGKSPKVGLQTTEQEATSPDPPRGSPSLSGDPEEPFVHHTGLRLSSSLCQVLGIVIWASSHNSALLLGLPPPRRTTHPRVPVTIKPIQVLGCVFSPASSTSSGEERCCRLKVPARSFCVLFLAGGRLPTPAFSVASSE